MVREECAGSCRLPESRAVAAEDEVLADAARARYRVGSAATVEVDTRTRAALVCGEQLLEIRQVSIRRLPDEGGSEISGRLAVTTERMVIVGRTALTVAALDDVEDVTLSADLLQITLKGGVGFTIESSRPRLLRVHLAEARARSAARQLSLATPAASSDLPRR